MMNMLKCCGKNRRSYFCPDCGKCLIPPDSPGLSLLLHINSQIKIKNSLRDRTRARYAGTGEEPPKECILEIDRWLEKWHSWESFVRKALNGQESKKICNSGEKAVDAAAESR